MKNPLKIVAIDFRPCTGFGSEGRSAALYVQGSHDPIGVGCGATDEEAIAEALIDAGVEYPYEQVGAALKGARIYREQPEFSRGEFPSFDQAYGEEMHEWERAQSRFFP